MPEDAVDVFVRSSGVGADPESAAVGARGAGGAGVA